MTANSSVVAFVIEPVHKRMPQYRFLLFSNGKDSELVEFLAMPYVERVFFGSPIADIFGIASAKALIGSHSIFTDWGGQVNYRHCCPKNHTMVLS